MPEADEASLNGIAATPSRCAPDASWASLWLTWRWILYERNQKKRPVEFSTGRP